MELGEAGWVERGSRQGLYRIPLWSFWAGVVVQNRDKHVEEVSEFFSGPYEVHKKYSETL